MSLIAILIISRAFGIPSHASELLQYRPAEFLSKYSLEGVLLLTLYALYLIVASSVIGAYNTPERVSTCIVAGVTNATRWVSNKHRVLRWIPVPSQAIPPEPIWYYAFNRYSRDNSRTPIVIATLRNGGVYVGEMASYPIVSDTQIEKDFLIQRASYYRDGDIYNDQPDLDSLDDEIDAVLLNTSQVESIRLYFESS